MSNTSKAKGTGFETSLLPALRMLDRRTERRALKGAKDRGDFTTLYLPGDVRVVVSAKAVKSWSVRAWLKELDAMMVNDEADNGILVAKLKGVADPMQQAVIMKMEHFINLVSPG